MNNSPKRLSAKPPDTEPRLGQLALTVRAVGGLSIGFAYIILLLLFLAINNVPSGP